MSELSTRLVAISGVVASLVLALLNGGFGSSPG